MKTSKNFALLNFFLKCPWYIFNWTSNYKTAYPYGNFPCLCWSCQSVNVFPQLQNLFCCDIYGKNMWKYKHEYAKSL